MTKNKNFKGLAIYNPSGKAGEYSFWACNFFVGCSNDCDYCYCKKGVLGSIMGGKIPTLKKCFRDEEHALEVFYKELLQNKEALQKNGLFFTFTSDPMLPETIKLTWQSMDICICNKIPVKILTKCADWVQELIDFDNGSVKNYSFKGKQYVAIGFTLTGHDELEPGASTNIQRIRAMELCKQAGFKTFASIEPIIDFDSSLRMIEQTVGVCDLYKIGLLSGRKYDVKSSNLFISSLRKILKEADCSVYLKESLLNSAGLNRQNIDEMWTKSVGRDYNLFDLNEH